MYYKRFDVYYVIVSYIVYTTYIVSGFNTFIGIYHLLYNLLK